MALGRETTELPEEEVAPSLLLELVPLLPLDCWGPPNVIVLVR